MPVEKRKETYRVGMIGCGGKGTGHARTYQTHPATEVVAGCDPDPEQLERFCRAFKVPGYTNYEEMLRKERIDIAAPILPVSANPDVVVGCTRFPSVKGIQSEKPLAASLADADRMVQACRDRGIKFAAGDMDRNIHNYWDAKKLIDEGAIGEVKSIHILYGSGLEISGGGCQFLSLARLFASDADVDWVIGWMAKDPWSDYDQGAAGYIRFANGIECFMTRTANPKNGVEVLGTQGALHSDIYRIQMWRLPAERRGESVAAVGMANREKITAGFLDVNIWPRAGEHDEEGWAIYPRNYNTVQSLVDALDKNIEPRSSGDNGRKVLEIGIGLRESHRSGMTPVHLPLSDRSLRMMPYWDRMYARKEQMGRERYYKGINYQWKGFEQPAVGS
ncbi:MAG: Gfo/Idh/MocA family oxidoreductase [SAR202 cluster bacterium]|nr:Gfo/Idh/MocA family oxidoreductase [SAR202 cluster bacterium]